MSCIISRRRIIITPCSTFSRWCLLMPSYNWKTTWFEIGIKIHQNTFLVVIGKAICQKFNRFRFTMQLFKIISLKFGQPEKNITFIFNVTSKNVLTVGKNYWFIDKKWNQIWSHIKIDQSQWVQSFARLKPSTIQLYSRNCRA